MIDFKNLESAKIGVVGAGSWGTALANLLADKGFRVDLWAYETEIKDQIKKTGENQVFLPGVKLSENLFPSNDMGLVTRDKDLLLTVVPSHLVRNVSTTMNDYVSKTNPPILVSASKGIENKTHLTMSSVLKETMGSSIPENQFAVITGPSFAKEVARGVPTLVTVAAANQKLAAIVQQIFATPVFRVYTIDDMIGVELGGSVKNVIAIASGIVDGLGLGLNTRAALITRGLAEIKRLGLRLGAKAETFSGLAGVGDLLLTCTGTLSRNHTVGKKIGEGKKLEEILSEMRMVAEGVNTARSVYNLSVKLGVEMPISHAVFHVLHEGKSAGKAVEELMTRSLKKEMDE